MAGRPTNRCRTAWMLDLSTVPLIDDHSHAGLYERRLGRFQTLSDLNGPDEHYHTSAYRALLREACANLYGGESKWHRGVSAQSAHGVEPAFTESLERAGIGALVRGFRRLA